MRVGPAALLSEFIFYGCCHKLPHIRGLKRHEFILQFCRPGVHIGSHEADVKVSAALCSFREALGRTHLLVFPKFQRPPPPVAVASSL